MANHQFKQKKEDEYYTKEYAVFPIMKYIDKNLKVWHPFDTLESSFCKKMGSGIDSQKGNTEYLRDVSL